MVMISFFKRKVYPAGCFINEYKVIRLIGEGRFGVCYLVNLGGKEYVLKEIKPKAIKKNGSKIIFEKEILSSIEHPSIPKIFDTIINDDMYAYILEYKTGKTIEEMLFEDNHVFTQPEIYEVGKRVINIIKYLHDNNIVHRDIRVPNVILHENNVHLIDFGLARFINNERYVPSADFSYFGHLLLHLHYSSFEKSSRKSKPWYSELELTEKNIMFLKKLIGIKENYKNIIEVEDDFCKVFG
ncbi:protein kinase [Clostridium sp. 001]|nr:protein kinase [Clostridium sp. 001]